MDIPKLTDVTDLVYRRVGDNLKDDLVKQVYATYEYDRVKLTFILGNHLDTNTLASMAVRYNHYFSDVHPNYTVQLLDQPNHFTPKADSYIIWSYDTGFTIRHSYGG